MKSDLTREERAKIIYDMCLTWRHDFGLIKENDASSLVSGITKDERDWIWHKMSQIFENVISPLLNRESE